MRKRLLKELIKNHKYLVGMYLLGAFLIFILTDFGYLDMYQWFKEESSNDGVGVKIMHCIKVLFQYKINLTIIITVIGLIIMNAFFYILDLEYSLYQVMFRSGYSKRMIGCYVIVFSSVLNLIPLLICSFLFTFYCIAVEYSIRVGIGAFLFSVILLVIDELVVGIYYAKNSNKLL